MTATPVTSLIDVGGRATVAVRGGRGDPTLYLHGLAGDVHATTPGDDWPPMLSMLAGERDVIAPAAPGYNGSLGAETLHDLEDYAFHHLDLLDALGLERVDVVGHSLGGWLAAEFALRHPTRVRNLVLVNPLGVYVRGAPVASFFGAVAPRGIGGLGEARSVLFTDPDGERATAALPDEMDDAQQLRWYGGLAGAARIGWPAPQFQSRALTGRLVRIAAPTLVVSGSDDRLVPADHVATWAGGIPGAELVTLPDCGHCAPWEQPREVGRAVLAGLAR